MTDLRSDSRRELRTAGGNVDFHALDALSGARLDLLPHTVKILLENLLRRSGGRDVVRRGRRGARRRGRPGPAPDVAFMPARVLMQDFTGVPAVVDLAAMRSAVARAGRRPGAA